MASRHCIVVWPARSHPIDEMYMHAAKAIGMPTAQAKQQCSAAMHQIRTALVVLSFHRWTKMLVRRQAHAFEITIGMA